MADETTDQTTDRESVPVSNVGYAEVPEGFVFVPGVTGGNDLLKKLFEAVDDPEDVITRAGYGYVVPKAAAEKAGVETVEVTPVIDLSTPDSTPAESGTDTQESPLTTSADEDEKTLDGPLVLGNEDPARHPDDEEAPADDTAATTSEAEGSDEKTSTTTSKKSSAAPAAS